MIHVHFHNLENKFIEKEHDKAQQIPYTRIKQNSENGKTGETLVYVFNKKLSLEKKIQTGKKSFTMKMERDQSTWQILPIVLTVATFLQKSTCARNDNR